MAQCSVGLHCCALQCWYHLTQLMGSIQKDQHPTASLSEWGALGEQESPMQALGAGTGEELECCGPPGWGHSRWVLVHAMILLSSGAPRPLVKVLKARARLTVGFWPTVVKDQLVTHIHVIFLLATPLSEGAASPPWLSGLWLPSFALRSQRTQPRGWMLPTDPFRDPSCYWTTPTANPSINWLGASCLHPPMAADAHPASQQLGKYIHEGVKKK